MQIPKHTRWRERKADHERADGIEDRPPIVDTRPVHVFDFREDGGEHWQAEPRAGFVSYRLRDMTTERVVYIGTLKQCLRWMSGRMVRRLGLRALH